MQIPYSLHVALQSIWREKWINLLTVLAVATSLLIVTLMYFAFYNIESLTGKLPERFSISVYLKDGLSQQDVQELTEQIKKRGDVAEVKYIAKEQALEELKMSVADISTVLEGLQDNPLSSSLEVKLRQEFVSVSSVRAISEALMTLPGVDSIYNGEKIAGTIAHLKHTVTTVGLAVFSLIAFGVVFIIYSSVKNLFYRKREDVEILKLLGASSSFIRLPFLTEGGTIGLVGGALGVLGAYGCYYLLVTQLGVLLPFVSMLVFPYEIAVALPLGGLCFGVFGALIAIGRIRFS
ncbi:MAG: cell division transport system permease protein [Nitrospirae bacterium]|nr:MAG: cell division transport system permease protein [Nitrospirota bacterium]